MKLIQIEDRYFNIEQIKEIKNDKVAKQVTIYFGDEKRVIVRPDQLPDLLQFCGKDRLILIKWEPEKVENSEPSDPSFLDLGVGGNNSFPFDEIDIPFKGFD